MTGGARLYLLDTNIVVHYVRGNELSKRIEKQFNLLHQSERPLVSVVSIGELKALAHKLGWGARKRETLERQLRELIVVDISSREVLEAYGEIDEWTESNGARIGQQNDLWIAATARATSAHLITTDRDFDVLHPDWIRRTFTFLRMHSRRHVEGPWFRITQPPVVKGLRDRSGCSSRMVQRTGRGSCRLLLE